MNYSRFNSPRLRLIGVLLIGVLVPCIVVGRDQSGQKVPSGFRYPPSHETIKVEAEIESRSLSGVVTDPRGVGASRVLVERVEAGWGKRISAVLSNRDGRFAFPIRSGTHFLRVSKPGFNTMLLKVRVSRKTKSLLHVELQLSN